MKRIALLILCLFVPVCSLAGCQEEPAISGQLQVVATLFPQYDFARRVAGDRAQITLLLPPGVESHSFDPTPADIVTVQRSDIFLYTGAQMETWAGSLVSSLSNEIAVVDLSQGISLSGDAHEDDSDAHDHSHLADPHIWTSPKNAKIMVASIRDAFCQADPDGTMVYQENARQYLEELEQLDADICNIVEGGKRRTLAFSGRFALHYFAEEYGLDCVAALESCSGESEPSAQSVAQVISVIREQSLPVVYYEELSDPKVGRSIASETGVQLMLFHSCHNLSKDEFERGETYLTLMRQNAENLKVGLNQ